jgi:acyl carrier protein
VAPAPFLGHNPGVDTLRNDLEDFFRREAPGIDLAGTLPAQLNSLALVRLVTLLEKRFSVRIENIEIDDAHFGSVDAVERLLRGKLR